MGRRRSGEMPRVTVVRPRNHARVRIGGKAHWLGKYPHGRVTASQQAEAARLWHEYFRNLPLQPFSAEPEQPVEEGVLATATPQCLTVAGLMVAYLDHADAYYCRADGSKTSSVDGVRMAARAVIPWSNVPAVAFGPRLLKYLKAAEVRAGRPRTTVNRIAKLIRSAFKWAAGEELVAVETWQGLQAVAPIKKGRTTAAEIPPVEEVPGAIVIETLAVLPRIVAAMVEFQRWTGARPGEVCLLRPCDIDL